MQHVSVHSTTFPQALFQAISSTAQGTLSEGDKRLLHFHLDQAMERFNSIRSNTEDKTQG